MSKCHIVGNHMSRLNLFSRTRYNKIDGFASVSGLPRFRSDWTKLLQYNQIDVIVWVVDSTDIHRFQESRQALHTFLEEPMANRLPVIIVAAKQVKSSNQTRAMQN